MLTHFAATLNQAVKMSGLSAHKATQRILCCVTTAWYYIERMLFGLVERKECGLN